MRFAKVERFTLRGTWIADSAATFPHTHGAKMRTYLLMGTHSDVSILEVDGLGDHGFEITTADCRTWSCLDAEGAIEQLAVLRDQGVKLPPWNVELMLRLAANRPHDAACWSVSRRPELVGSL